MKNFFTVSVLALALSILIGWGMNLYATILGCIEFIPATSNWAFLVLRAVGIFVFPLGGVLGLFF